MGLLTVGCGSPSAANITLRKQNQELSGQVDQLKRELEGARASLRSMEARATTVPVLPGAQLDRLFTIHALKLGRGTGPTDLDITRPGDEGLKVQAAPVDQTGQPIKAAGAFKIDAFDLALRDRPL
ncbi:MAG TPA: hypothetical protein VF669_14475, partial [Tepidisphaeraceae bacterium]